MPDKYRLCQADSQGCMMRMACGDCECPEDPYQEEIEVYLDKRVPMEVVNDVP